MRKNINNVKYIENQIITLQQGISKLVDGDFVYIDDWGNLGDKLITLGALKLLENVKFQCKYKTTLDYIDFSKIGKNDIIIVKGGGNFGDIYREQQLVRQRITQKFPENKIVFFPQSTHYQDESLIAEDAAIFAQHKNLTIVARDNVSFYFLKKYFAKNHITLLPDTALGLYHFLPKKQKQTGKTLYMNRKDVEKGEVISNVENMTEFDWDDLSKEKMYKFLRLPLRMQKKKAVFSKKFINFYEFSVMYPYYCRRAARFFLQFDTIYTSRLHGAILAEMLHLNVHLLDNSYKKLSNYFGTWFKL
ncbi:MAG: polysaccharide pyruvyl transferase family protein [Prevotellaceae bacterium]|nr:polysaccharide pyruvyl transferase family protein [Prevotellaceae bacterium]